jgi:hypothetical protein
MLPDRAASTTLHSIDHKRDWLHVNVLSTVMGLQHGEQRTRWRELSGRNMWPDLLPLLLLSSQSEHGVDATSASYCISMYCRIQPVNQAVLLLRCAGTEVDRALQSARNSRGRWTVTSPYVASSGTQYELQPHVTMCYC